MAESLAAKGGASVISWPFRRLSQRAVPTDRSQSTAHRHALQLADCDFLRRTDSGAFRLGDRFVCSELENAGVPVPNDLRDHTGEAAQLWIRRGDERGCRGCGTPQLGSALTARGNTLAARPVLVTEIW